MKTFLKITMGVFVLSLLVACSSKKDIDPTPFVFKNQSSHTVYVTPDTNQGGAWESFSLEPNESKTVYTYAFSMCFSYTPYDVVGGHFVSDEDKAVFVDR